MHRLYTLLLFTISFTSFGQIEEVRRITETLCSPEFHGRGYVNKGDSIASEFLASEFEKLGVKPFGESYFQRFGMSINRFPGKMQVTHGRKALVPGKDFVVSPGAQGERLLLNPKKFPGEKMHDIDLVKELISEVTSSNEFNGLLFDFTEVNKDTLKKYRSLVGEVARVVPVVQVMDEKFTWYLRQTPETRVFIQVQKSAYQPGESFKIDIESEFVEKYETQNVIAHIPGTKGKKTIVFTAHYDHLGRMGTDTYFPGANDNASGTAMLFTMAKHFKENPPKHNIVFIAFAGEEAGLLGSKYYVEHPLFPLEDIRFLVNLDIMGSGEHGITAVNSTLFQKEYKALLKINRKKNLLAKIKKRGPAANSDHYWFTEKGVPAFFIYTMGPNKHYHDVFDVYEELSFSEYADITTLLIDFVKYLK